MGDVIFVILISDIYFLKMWDIPCQTKTNTFQFGEGFNQNGLYSLVVTKPIYLEPFLVNECDLEKIKSSFIDSCGDRADPLGKSVVIYLDINVS